jgi:hypothetical protein
MRHIILLFIAFSSFVLKAQIGYQVTILDTATGEPSANETISATITISGAGGAICSEVKTATTDEFGVLSLEVGNSDTFANVDWTKLPLYISATVDGVLIGRTQVLSVPIAEYAKQTGALTKNILCGRTWDGVGSDGATISISFSSNGRFTYNGLNKTISGHYGLCGNTVGLENCGIAVYIPNGGILQIIGPERAALH